MQQIVQVIVRLVSILLSALEILMLVRAIQSWLPLDDDNPFHNFVYLVTEPLIAPVRAIVERFPSMQGLPIDISFFITMILLMMLGIFLPEVSF